MKTRCALSPSSLHVLVIILLFLSGGCGSVVQNSVEAPKNTPSGFVEFTIDDTTRWAAHGWTVPISEKIDGEQKKYGFLGRDVFLAPFGYSKVRRVPLPAGPHTLDLVFIGADGGTSLTLEVIAGKVTPVTVRIDLQDYDLVTKEGHIKILCSTKDPIDT